MTTKNTFSGDSEVLPAPHANSDVEARLRFFVQGYYDFTKDAADIYVRKCMLVREAEDDLPPEAVQRFFDQIRLPRDSSTYRKVRKIADAGDRLLRVAHLLPDSWTTICELSKVEPHIFDELVQADVLNPGMTAADLRAATKKPTKKEKFIITIDASALSKGEQVQVYRKVKGVADEYGATVSALPDDKAENSKEYADERQ
jgi:hypothetical protein